VPAWVKRWYKSVKTPINPLGRHRMTETKMRLYTVNCTPPCPLPNQLYRSAEVASSNMVPTIGPHNVPMPPTIETSAASTEMLKLNAVFGSMK